MRTQPFGFLLSFPWFLARFHRNLCIISRIIDGCIPCSPISPNIPFLALMLGLKTVSMEL